MRQHLEARRKEHWNLLGIHDEKSLKDHIKTIFKQYDHQTDVLIEIYKLVLPDWDRIQHIEGYPEAGNKLWKFICNQFIEFDQEHHPKVFKGGVWLNTGFTSNTSLRPWQISFENCQVTMN